MAAVFLRAEWRKLIMANYPVDAAALRPFLPERTELDTWEGETFVSLVGFMFRKVRIRGIRIPFHTNFPEVNLRFYVRYKEGTNWKRGVVFIREIVPLPAVSFIANTIFHERYISMPMRNKEVQDAGLLQLNYQWKYKGRWNSLAATTASGAVAMQEGSQTEFITEHFWGYTNAGGGRTGEYQVAHPRWDIYPLTGYAIDCDFGALYGPAFASLERQQPQSVFLAEGSPVEIYPKRRLP